MPTSCWRKRDFCLTVFDLLSQLKTLGPNKKYLINTRLNRGTKGTISLNWSDGKLCKCQPKQVYGESTRLVEGEATCSHRSSIYLSYSKKWILGFCKFGLKKLKCLHCPKGKKETFLLGNSHEFLLCTLSHF